MKSDSCFSGLRGLMAALMVATLGSAHAADPPVSNQSAAQPTDTKPVAPPSAFGQNTVPDEAKVTETSLT